MTPPRAGGPGGDGYFDLDAAVTAAEADFEPFRFTYRGEKYEVPAQGTWPVRAVALLARGELAQALELLIGADTWARLEKAGFSLAALNALFEAVSKASGLGGLPNSSTPPRPGSRPT